ncbi:Reticulon [Cynara cardunculus var. scolymus]|uniref:Reticulon n=1 Tax=Cynara cardunculus var. scolymus TaxID=59895 RepID=A0A103XS18_CYNCS|nr:Reticulon [Cynara cardunculus var. scolymus]
MDSPPPYTTGHRSNPPSQTKSASRLARTTAQEPPPVLSLDLVSYSPNSPKPQNLHDLLLLSPSPAKRSKTRLDVAEEISDQQGSRRRCKNRFANVGSPRTTRRSRRRVEQEIREDKDKYLICVDDLVVANNKVKKRRHSGRSKKDKSISIPSPKGNNDDYGYDFDQIGLMVNDLIMWNDVAKSSLWFGFGSLCFLSSCFATGISFSMLSLISQLGLVCLGVSFFSNTIAQRNGIESKRELKLKEEDVLRAARVVLPAANFAISKARDLFSGEPSMTLKVAPLLLLGSEYGHIVTFKRLFALGKTIFDSIHNVLIDGESLPFVYASFRVLYRLYRPKTLLVVLDSDTQERKPTVAATRKNEHGIHQGRRTDNRMGEVLTPEESLAAALRTEVDRINDLTAAEPAAIDVY